MSRNAESIPVVSKETDAGAQELARSTEELNRGVQNLNSLVSQSIM